MTPLLKKVDFEKLSGSEYARAQGVTAHMLIPDAGASENGVNNALKFVKENEGKDWIIAGDSLAGMPEYLSNENGPFASKIIFAAAWDVCSRVRLQEKLSEPTFKADSLGVELRFRERSGEIANPNITLTTIAKCGDRYTTVNFRKPICPNPNPIPDTP